MAAGAQVKKLVMGSDHAAFDARKVLAAALEKEGYTVQDVGCPSSERCDYPDFAQSVCDALLSSAEPAMAILMCGSGVGQSIAGGKFKGVRPALVHDEFTARAARQLYDSNMLVLGARTTGQDMLLQCCQTFLTTSAVRHGADLEAHLAPVSHDSIPPKGCAQCRNVVLASDHASAADRALLRQHLEQKGVTVADAGSAAAGDFGEFEAAATACKALCESKQPTLAIVLGETGIGAAMRANRVAGVRAALCRDDYTARMTRLHNDSNCIVFGTGVVGRAVICSAVDQALGHEWEGGRHAGRLEKLMALEGKWG
eukprot:TRINITY_DN5437_c0_g1_i1.p1 TRINITY_DN5437_c0_g1~~TRINITY_DN5437_c0_g1_i1.p1  ORF type:complete len:344 (+),score=127.48 TRINITY_DN5437_c0_g1_i1:95-1033(+)